MILSFLALMTKTRAAFFQIFIMLQPKALQTLSSLIQQTNCLVISGKIIFHITLVEMAAWIQETLTTMGWWTFYFTAQKIYFYQKTQEALFQQIIIYPRMSGKVWLIAAHNGEILTLMAIWISFGLASRYTKINHILQTNFF